MFLQVPDYAIANNEPYTVVAETTTRSESEEYIASKRLFESCFVSKDKYEEVYRVICLISEVKSAPTLRESR